MHLTNTFAPIVKMVGDKTHAEASLNHFCTHPGKRPISRGPFFFRGMIITACVILRDAYNWMTYTVGEAVDITVGDAMQNKNDKTRILFLCTGNSARSQMAEGWARHLRSGVIEPYSAGIEAHGVNPYAVAAMKEAGIDISGQRSKLMEEIIDTKFDYVVTLCSHADENCPLFPGKTKVIHVGFDDPAKATDSEGEVMATFRRVRDEIRRFVESLPDSLEV